MEHTLAVAGCRKTFAGPGRERVVALDTTDIALVPGRLVAVLGSNGAGKSTLLNVIAGGLVPDEGTVHLRGRDVTAWPSWKRARHLWTIRQDPATNVLGKLTIEENMALAQACRSPGTGLGRLLRKERRVRSAEALAALGMGLEDRLGASGAELSGGQRQAVAVAMAVVAQPDLLLCDEHAAALDPRSARTVVAATRDLVHHRGIACLMITHNLEQAAHTADRIVIMHQGRIVVDLDNETQQLTADDLLGHFEKATGGNVPDTVQLVASDTP